MDAPDRPAGVAAKRHVVFRIFEPRVAGPLVAVVIAATTAFFIFRISGTLHLNDIRAAISEAPWSAIGWSVSFTIVSFGATSLYDVVAREFLASI